MRLKAQIIGFVIVVLAGFVLYPRPSAHVSPGQVVSQALHIRQSPGVPVADIRSRLASGCTPVLEGSDVVDGAEVWAVRLKIPAPKKYPWLELWIDKKSGAIVAWKEWGNRGKKVLVLAHSPNAD